MRGGPIRAVTFDCWGTLILESDPGVAHGFRLDALARAASRLGHAPSTGSVSDALDAAWHRHWDHWSSGVGSGAMEIAVWALDHLGIGDPEAAAELAEALSEAALEGEVRALDGARETLELLAEMGIRTALVCDTGLVRGTIVRRLLDRVSLGALLEVHVYSDEVGHPKPHAAPFEAALSGLGVGAEESIHVGDLRRTDVAGARALGMGTIRIRDHHDDRADHLPEADAVADGHVDLRRLLEERID